METKKKQGTPPPRYDDAFKAGAMRMVTEQGRQPAEVAKDLGKSTAHGYNAPCFDGMVHCFVGSGLIRRDNEDGKDNIKSAYRTV